MAALAALSAAGCATHDDHQTVTQEVGCPSWSCGSNTATVADYAIEGLNLDDLPNDQGITIVPGSLEVPNPCNDTESLDLDVIGGELVAKDAATHAVVCSGSELEGASFELARLEESWEIQVRSVASVPLWVHREPPPGVENLGYELVTVYDFEWEVVGGGVDGPLCPETWAWGTDTEWLPPSAPAEPTVPGDPSREVLSWEQPGRYAVLLGDELYDGVDATVRAANRWFNIGCSGTALAKMRLMGYDPQDPWHRTDRLERQATLKMITAKYCGAESYTVTGTPLEWQNERLWFEPTGRDLGPIEALWDEHGAICLSSSRRYSASAPNPPEEAEADFVEAIRAACEIPSCEELEIDWEAPLTYPWITWTVDHPDGPVP